MGKDKWETGCFTTLCKNYGGSELDTTIETSDINWNIFSIDKIVVTNHTLEIGVYSVAGANDWCNLDLAMLRKID